MCERQTALVVLLAHIGCHVPADAATVPLLRRVFTRIGASDALESQGSTFACEMRETTYVLRNLGEPALVIVDELGRGTSNSDGASLGFAIAEQVGDSPRPPIAMRLVRCYIDVNLDLMLSSRWYLVELVAQLALSPKTFTLFATHYLWLANLRNLYPQHVRLLFATQYAPRRPALAHIHSLPRRPQSHSAPFPSFTGAHAAAASRGRERHGRRQPRWLPKHGRRGHATCAQPLQAHGG